MPRPRFIWKNENLDEPEFCDLQGMQAQNANEMIATNFPQMSVNVEVIWKQPSANFKRVAVETPAR